ncbi:universal stress protein [Neobacillus kokaensis]|uniref:Universal stress protein YxiE n=1 Tax=Neobacillus kokaensis TaxID=2759023 RepID=A0ABQ3NAK3_9BACI|nr:universal stress protein [Neobacillus kokaensis]GHI00736.1 universal stress protein YxiE [Neobacillus kokaensis]
MLNMFSKIVVPYDNSELSKKALDTAITLAKQDEGILLDVITVINPNYAAYRYGVYSIDPIHKAQLEEAKKMLKDLEQKLSELPNQANTHLFEGSPGASIIDFVNSEQADLVVMGSRGLSGLKEVFLGSVSHYVVQKSPCPVFIVK